MHTCSQCGKENQIVNECGCDPNNLPTKVKDAETTTELLENKTETKVEEKEEGKELKGGLGTDRLPVPERQPEEKPLDVQATLNEMFIKHGGNLPERGDYKDLLADYGLELNQVTRKHLDLAKKNLAKFIEEESKKQPPERDNKLEWDTEPCNFAGETCKGIRWTTKCQRYRVDLRRPIDQERSYFMSSYLTKHGNDMPCEFAPPRENNMEGSEPRKYKNLDAALASVEKWHGERFKIALVASNRQQVLDVAAELGITKPLPKPKPKPATQPMPASMPIATPGAAQGSTLPQGQATGLPAQPKAPRTTYKILGHSLSRICYYMGNKGWPYERAVRVLAHYGIPVGEGGANVSSVRTYLTDGRNPVYSKPANLTPDQAEELEKIV